jgi:hypothetical protein
MTKTATEGPVFAVLKANETEYGEEINFKRLKWGNF